METLNTKLNALTQLAAQYETILFTHPNTLPHESKKGLYRPLRQAMKKIQAETAAIINFKRLSDKIETGLGSVTITTRHYKNAFTNHRNFTGLLTKVKDRIVEGDLSMTDVYFHTSPEEAKRFHGYRVMMEKEGVDKAFATYYPERLKKDMEERKRLEEKHGDATRPARILCPP